MMAVPVTTQPAFTAGVPKILFEGAYRLSGMNRSYEVTPDGRRFLMLQQNDRPPLMPNTMILVQNWLEELKQRVPTK